MAHSCCAALVPWFAFIPVIVCLWAMTPEKQTAAAAAVFTNFTDNGAGWPNIGATVLVGQVSAIFVVLGSDSVAHMSEEIEDAGIIVPRAMVWSFLLNVPFTVILLVTYLFTEALSSITGFPFIYVFQNATGGVGGTTGFVIVILVLLIMITISSLALTSRQTFAFARDNGLPFSKWIGTVNPRFYVPVNAMIFTALFTMVVSLINIGSYVPFNAVLSLASTAMTVTYIISIGCVTYRRFMRLPLPASRWSLGRAGLWVNCMALLYTTWALVWSFFPNAYTVTLQNFNWASVLFVGLMSIATVLYWTHARHVYEGPVAKVVPLEDDASD